jgi:hypothetical protein
MLPMQISHPSHGLKQLITGVHGWHAVGSPLDANEHDGTFVVVERLPRYTKFEVPGSWQQPKQSQPLGVSEPQRLIWQREDESVSSHVALTVLAGG